MGGYGCRRGWSATWPPGRDGPGTSEAPEKVLVLDITGIISSFTVDRGGAGMVDWVDDQLDRAEEDYAIKAVILKVDSPGGEVLASDRIYERIRRFQEDSGKPVIASMGGLAASVAITFRHPVDGLLRIH